MNIRIKYENPKQHGEFIIEELDDSVVNVPQYCIDLHKTQLCEDGECTGMHCKIWVEINGEFLLSGVVT